MLIAEKTQRKGFSQEMSTDSSEHSKRSKPRRKVICTSARTCLHRYKDTYSPVTFKCTQEFVLVTFHLYSALTNRQNIIISHV